MTQMFLDGRVMLHAGDCLDVVRGIADCSIDAVVTDPPYALVSISKRYGADGAKPPKAGDAYARGAAGFMGKRWDNGEVAFAVAFWREIWRVLKPGGHVAAFSGTRTYHHLATAIEQAGFEIRDQLGWAYGTGFPKSHDVSKGIDKHNGDKREKIPKRVAAPAHAVLSAGHNRPWMDNPDHRVDGPDPASAASAAWQGWGTALKPAWEPICLARKPLVGTVAANVLAHGTGALNIAGCRIGDDGGTRSVVGVPTSAVNAYGNGLGAGIGGRVEATGEGRWPANILHDGSDEVLAAFRPLTGDLAIDLDPSRFFYSAKADAHDRIGSKHPTVKPVDLMQWLSRLITPPGGTLLDPFAGTGTTGEAAWREGFSAVLIEREEEYRADIARRMALAVAGPATRKAESLKARNGAPEDHGPLFGGASAPIGGGELCTVNSQMKTGVGGGQPSGIASRTGIEKPAAGTNDRPRRTQAVGG